MDARPILLAEDDRNDVFLCQHAMSLAGVSNPLHVVRDGDEALRYIQGVGPFADRIAFPLPIILLLDVKMPKLTGLDVLAWLHEHPDQRSFMTIVFSSSSIPADIAEAYRLGAHSFVIKPASIDERVEFWRALQNWWLRFNEFPE
jgi:CheY-like chemotaxis protein